MSKLLSAVSGRPAQASGEVNADTASAAQIEITLNAQSAEVITARAAHDRLVADRPRALLDGTDDQLRQLDDDIAAAKRRQDRAEARVENLMGALETARAREAEAARTARLEAVRKRRDAARGRLEQEYKKLAAGLLDLLTAVKLIDDEVIAANKDLPHGAEPLDKVEATLRYIPGSPERSETIVGSRVKPDSRGNVFSGMTVQQQIEKFEERRVIQAVRPRALVPLYNLFELPGFGHADPSYRVAGTHHR